jgi:hypothetical protein
MGALGLLAAPLARAFTIGSSFPKPGGISTLPTPITSLTGGNSVEGFLCGLVLWFFWGLIVLSVVMFLVGGYRYVTSGGDSEKVSSANKTLLYAAVAVVVALVAAGMPYIVNSFLTNGANFGTAC